MVEVRAQEDSGQRPLPSSLVTPASRLHPPPSRRRYEFRGDPNEIFANLFKSFRGGFDEDDMMGGFGFGPGMMGGFGPGGGSAMFQQMNGMGGFHGMGGMMGKRPFTSDVGCTLEELYHGTTKKLKITRQCQTAGRPREHVFEIQVRPRRSFLQSPFPPRSATCTPPLRQSRAANAPAAAAAAAGR